MTSSSRGPTVRVYLTFLTLKILPARLPTLKTMLNPSRMNRMMAATIQPRPVRRGLARCGAVISGGAAGGGGGCTGGGVLIGGGALSFLLGPNYAQPARRARFP